MQQERHAALVVSVWLESGELRARLTSVDTAAPEAREVDVALAASSAAVVEGVRAWLGEFLAPANAQC